MLLGKSIRDFHAKRRLSISSQTEETKFKFPEPKSSSVVKPTTTSNNPTKDEDKKKPQHRKKNVGLVNIATMLFVMTLLKLLIGSVTPVPPINLPSLDKILPGRIPLPNLVLIVYPLLAVIGSLQVEKLVSENRISQSLSSLVHYAIILLSFALPITLSHPLIDLDGLMVSLYTTLVYIVLAIKMISFVSVNRTFREAVISSNNNCDEAKIYPSNLTAKNLLIFWCSPSLVYCPKSLASTVSRRYSYLVFRFIELCSLLLLIRIPLMMISDVTLSLLDLIKMDSELYLVMLERYLTISILYMMTWLTSFYIIFVSFLEFVSELTGSQERRFYQSWWDATTMEEFWRWWNLPVHRWCVKHVYLPLLARGGDKIKAMMAVFLFSASLHEFLISVPLCVTGHFAFFAFLGQGLVCHLSSIWTRRFGSIAGNLMVWSILMFGNSAGVLIYYSQVLSSMQEN